MSRSLSRLQAFVLGVVVLVGLGLAGFGVFAIGNRQLLWGDTFQLNAGFKEIRGVETGTRVRIQGIEAGEVSAVDYPTTPGGDVVLRMRLNSKLRHLIRADAVARIASEGLVGGKVVEIDPGTPEADVAQAGATIASKPSREITEVFTKVDHLAAQVDGVLSDVRKGEGSLGMLLQDGSVYLELLQLLKQGRGTLASIEQDANAIKDLPIIRSYVKDAYKTLVRPDCERNRKWFNTSQLFAPGQAVLTAQGRKTLDRIAPWANGLKHSGSEVVVAGYSEPSVDSRLALALTQKQSEAVCNYLQDQHSVHKTGWFSSRYVTPLGMGVSPPPIPEPTPLPSPRIEIMVFVPQG